MGFDIPRRCVDLKSGVRLQYDYLIVDTGCSHSYFGRNDWATLALGLKIVEEAIEIRRRILLAVEMGGLNRSVQHHLI
jgi:NADH:ubiquinone reductase (H+-translocating)